MRKIVDCSMFYNELDMLEFRLEYLNDVVDFFVIVEATKTFIGKEKPLFLKENLSRFEKHIDKIILMECDDLSDFDPASSNAWSNEFRHRNYIDKGIEEVNRLHSLDESDVVIISDIDEIPDVQTLSDIKEKGIKGLHTLVQDLYYYNLGCKLPTKWKYSKALDFETYKSFESPQEIRNTTFSGAGTHIERGGWHFSYFGTPEFIRNKIENFAHQEYNSEEYKDIEKIKSKVAKGKYLYEEDIKMEFIDPSENEYLPKGHEKLLRLVQIWNPLQ